MRDDPPEFVALTQRAVNLIRGENRPLKTAPTLKAMRGRYTLLETMKVPVGPIYIFWVDVYLYARSDLVAAPRSATSLRRQDRLSMTERP